MLNKKLMLAALWCGLQAAAAVQAAETWLPAGKAGDETLEMDASRFERQASGVTAWIKIKYAQPQKIPFSQTQFDAAERAYFFQCDKRLMVMPYNRMFDGVKVVYTYDANKPGGLGGGAPLPQNVPDGGIDAAAFDFACKYKAP